MSASAGAAPLIGVLALQGDFAAHATTLGSLGAHVREVRTAVGLDDLDGLVIPGGESTVIMLGIEREGLADPLRSLAASGTPILGTCAGLIVLGRDHLGLMDLDTRRNAFGRQIRSFEADLQFRDGHAAPLRAVFIRAPWIESAGPGVEILASIDGHPVAAREANVLGVAFHPELSGESRVHALLLELVAERLS